MRQKAQGWFKVEGVGQSVSDGATLSVPLSGKVTVKGHVAEAIVAVEIPASLVGTLKNRLEKPLEQLPLFTPGLVALNLRRA